MRNTSIALCLIALTLGLASAASAADAQAGKVLVDQDCAVCHGGMMSMWQGKSAADIDAAVHEVIDGKVTHPKDLKPLGLTDAQIADIAAWWASAGGR